MKIPSFSPAGNRARAVILGGLLVFATVVGVGAGSLAATMVSSGPRPSTGDDPALAPGLAGSPLPSPSDLVVLTPTAAPTPTPAPTPILVPAPLTGLPVSVQASMQHVVAVMVDDHRDARPQSGFNAASQVWQVPAEGGIPRYMMIFQETVPGEVGPIRSARQYFIEWASEWKALYVHVGGAPNALATLRSKGRGELVYNADGFRFEGTQMWRDTTRTAPHNEYTDGPHLRAMAKIVGAADVPITPAWTFGPAASTWKRPAGTSIVVTYPYETITYRYDAATNSYPRFIDKSATQQVDAADGQPVAASNVVILRVRFGALNDGHPSKKRLEAEDVGSGEAIISSNGQVIRGTWEKTAVDAPTLLFGPDGEPITLTAGQTYVQVLALSYGYAIVEGIPPDQGIRER
ncbi:MAG: DUF3048 domain-containing protein [Candidatus Limnocylindrales bacterium]